MKKKKQVEMLKHMIIAKLFYKAVCFITFDAFISWFTSTQDSPILTSALTVEFPVTEETN